MARRGSKQNGTTGGGSRLRAVPWLLLLQAARVIGQRWSALSDRDRRRVVELLRTSRGRPGNLSRREREDLGKLVRKLQPARVARELLAITAYGTRRKRR